MGGERTPNLTFHEVGAQEEIDAELLINRELWNLIPKFYIRLNEHVIKGKGLPAVCVFLIIAQILRGTTQSRAFDILQGDRIDFVRGITTIRGCQHVVNGSRSFCVATADEEFVSIARDELDVGRIGSTTGEALRRLNEEYSLLRG